MFSPEIADLGVIIDEGKLLYPARWKKITIDQSKVLKNRLFRFLGATHQWKINGKSRKWQSIRNYS